MNFKVFLLIFALLIFLSKYAPIFTDIYDISVKSKYRYIRNYRYFVPWISVNHTSIFRVFSRFLCNIKARFTPIFLKITLIPHLLMFCKIRRKIKQGKSKNLRRNNPLFKALVCRGEEVRQGKEKASSQRSPSKQKKKP